MGPCSNHLIQNPNGAAFVNYDFSATIFFYFSHLQIDFCYVNVPIHTAPKTHFF